MTQELTTTTFCSSLRASCSTTRNATESRSDSEDLCLLDDFGVLSVCGLDAATFLQGQVTVDVEQMPNHTALISGHCDHKGRLSSNFLLLRMSQSQFYLLLHHGLIDVAQKALAKYAVFSKCDVTQCGDRLIAVSTNATAATEKVVGICESVNADCQSIDFTLGEKFDAASAENEHLKNLLIIDAVALQNNADAIQQLSEFNLVSPSHWHLQRVRSGIALIKETQSASFIPQMLNMDQIGAISWTKGCYTGQEVVARLHYRGSSNRRLFLFELCDSAKTDVANFIGSEAQASILNAEGKTIGEVIELLPSDAAGNFLGIAVVKLRDANKLQPTEVKSVGVNPQTLVLQCRMTIQDSTTEACLMAPPYISMEELLNVSEPDSE